MSIKEQIEKNISIIEVKKQAKLLLKSIRLTGEKSSLMLCQNQIAKDKGFLNWYDLYQSIKKEIENGNSIDFLILELVKNYKSNIQIKINKKQKNYEIIDGHSKTILNYSKLSYLNFIKVLLQFVEKINSNINKLEKITNINGYYEIQNVSIRCSLEKINSNDEETIFIFNVFKSNLKNKLQNLGYDENSSIQILNNLINQNTLIIAGRAGSGKSTALKEMIEHYYEEEKYLKHLKYLKNYRKNFNKNLHKDKGFFFDSIESHMESKIEGVNQKQTNNESDFKREVIKCLRKKPELLLISEIRSSEIAQTISQLNNRGIALLSSMHASSIQSAIKRLKGLKYNIKIGTTIVYQDLIQTICPHCAVKLKKDELSSKYQEILNCILKNKSKANLSKINTRGEWNIKCNHKRTLVDETITINKEMKLFIDQNQWEELEQYIQNLRKQNNLIVGKSIKQNRIEKVLKGEIPIESIFLFE